MADEIAAQFLRACRAEIAALKPGNVHIHADGHGMTAAQFLRSAEVAAPAVARIGVPVGERVLAAVEATRSAVGCNTNLGILLLAVPLARAAELERGTLRERLGAVLEGLTVADAEAVFAAIRLAAPGGLGHAAEHDVTGPATVPLRVAMAAAADRDRIARQYADGYPDVFALGVARARDLGVVVGGGAEVAEAVYMDFLTAFPDSHVVRKHGDTVAASLLEEARALRRQVEGLSEPERRTRLLAFDTRLKALGLNPGTAADLTVASLFAYALEGEPPFPPGRGLSGNCRGAP